MRILICALSVIASHSSFASGYTFLSQVSHSYHIPEHMLTFILVASLLLGLGLVYRSKVSDSENAIIPDKGITFKNLFEGIGEFMYNLARNIMGEQRAKEYFTVIITLFTFIFLSNVIGLIPGFLPPTDNLNTTLALGLFVFVYYNYQGVRAQGLIGHIKHFMGPVWYLTVLILPLEIISHCVRPISLGLRLKGNMEGDHLVLSIFSGLIPYIVPIPFYVVGLFVCFMQAFVFTILTMVYISLATERHDHGEAAH